MNAGKISHFRCWHKADIPEQPVNVRYWGRADIEPIARQVCF